MSLGGRPCALGKKRELVPAVPMDWEARLEHYTRDGDYLDCTPAQRRRFYKKWRRQMIREGRRADL